MARESMDYDVVIVGAGPSGLAAAIRLRIARILGMLLVVASLFEPANEAKAQSSRTFLPDLAFWFDCDGKTHDTIEGAIENSLELNGFRVLNIGRIQRNHDVVLYNSYVTALDKKRRMIRILSFLPNPGRYSVGLYSPPPTRRSPLFEETLLTFVRDELSCRVNQVTRNENGADASAFYGEEIKRIEGLFRQADDLQRGPEL